MTEPNLPGLGRHDEVDETPEADAYAVRIVFETTDVGVDRDDSVRWVLRWIEAALQEAPFRVETAYAYAISNVEVLDV